MRKSCSASRVPQRPAAPQCQQHSCSPRIWCYHHHAYSNCEHDASVLVVLTRVLPHMLQGCKARKQFAEDKQSKNMDYWNHVLWSQEFGSDGSQYVKWHPGECVYCTCVWDSAYHREFWHQLPKPDKICFCQIIYRLLPNLPTLFTVGYSSKPLQTKKNLWKFDRAFQLVQSQVKDHYSDQEVICSPLFRDGAGMLINKETVTYCIQFMQIYETYHIQTTDKLYNCGSYMILANKSIHMKMYILSAIQMFWHVFACDEFCRRNT